jgi:hypothetical protein
MKNHHKVGNRTGKPTYRTPATFRYQKYLKNAKFNIIKINRTTMKKNKSVSKEAGFIKQIILLIILIALIFFGYGAYQNIRKNPISESSIKSGISQTAEEQKKALDETTDQIIEDSKKSLGEKLKEKVAEIIDSIFGTKKENSL